VEEDAGARAKTGVSILHFRLHFGGVTQGATLYPFTKIVLNLEPGTLYQDLESIYCETLLDQTVSEGLHMLTADLQYLVVAYSDNWEYCQNLMTRIMRPLSCSGTWAKNSEFVRHGRNVCCWCRWHYRIGDTAR
jgi:hypothetical protein